MIFQWRTIFYVRVWLSSVQFNSIRDENDGWAHFQILVVVLFALPLIIICIYHIPLCSVWITLCCGCVSFSCGFSLVYLHHIAMHFIHMLCCSIPIQRASPNNGTHFAFRSFVCSFRSSCILWFVLYDSKTVFTSQHNSYLFLGCFVRYGRLHTMNEWQKFIIRVKIYQSKIRF